MPGVLRGCVECDSYRISAVMPRGFKAHTEIQGARVLILTGGYKGEEAVCLGGADRPGQWAISPDDSDEILSLVFEKDFGLLADLSANPQLN